MAKQLASFIKQNRLKLGSGLRNLKFVKVKMITKLNQVNFSCKIFQTIL
jgi:hypothetical protein